MGNHSDEEAHVPSVLAVREAGFQSSNGALIISTSLSQAERSRYKPWGFTVIPDPEMGNDSDEEAHVPSVLADPDEDTEATKNPRAPRPPNLATHSPFSSSAATVQLRVRNTAEKCRHHLKI